jgi:uncharacterized protein involved in exopolysaccharide biosynthesis
MQAPSDQPMVLRDYVQAFFRHKGKVTLWCLLVMVLAVAALIVLPRSYASTTKLFLRLGRENVSLDPTATTGTTLQVQETRETQVNSTRDMLLSRSLLEEVVEKLTPETILKGKDPSEDGTSIAARVSAWLQWIPKPGFSSSIGPAEQAVAKLEKSITVKTNRNSSVIDVHCVAKNPQLAQLILTTFLDAYQDAHLINNHTAGASKFFAEQSAELKKTLDAANDRLRLAKNESGLVSIAAEQKSLQDQLMQVESSKLAADASLAASEASIVSIKNVMAVLPEKVETQATTGLPNTGADYMRQELFKLQISLRELEAKLGDGHPVVLAVREQVKLSEATLKSQPTERTQTVTAVNPARQALDLDLGRAEVAVHSFRAKSLALMEQYAALQKRIQSVNEYEVRIAELERNAAIAATTYRSYVDHLEQARIVDALEAHRISNVNVVQAPTLVFKPVSPKTILVFGFAILAALGGSLGLVFMCEFFDNSLKTAEEVEERLNLPVLVTIPQNEQDHGFLDEPRWAGAAQG